MPSGFGAPGSNFDSVEYNEKQNYGSCRNTAYKMMLCHRKSVQQGSKGHHSIMVIPSTTS